MKNLLLVAMQYRNGERIYPAIPLLSKDFNIDVFKCYQMHPSHRWVGDNDLRKLFDSLYSEYIKNVFLDFNEIDFSKYDCILMEDNRRKADGGILSAIYSKSKCLTIGCTHGSGDASYEIDGHKKAWDKCFMFGKSSATESFHISGGIPCNDDLKKYQNIKKEHVLIICNFLGN